jgi:hypothetical protein
MTILRAVTHNLLFRVMQHAGQRRLEIKTADDEFPTREKVVLTGVLPGGEFFVFRMETGSAAVN